MSHVDGEEPPEEEQPEEEQQPLAEFDMEFVSSLPAGQVVTPVESEGRFTWLVVEGHVSPQARDEFVAHLRHIVGKGMWQQDWPGEPPRPAA